MYLLLQDDVRSSSGRQSAHPEKTGRCRHRNWSGPQQLPARGQAKGRGQVSLKPFFLILKFFK